MSPEKQAAHLPATHSTCEKAIRTLQRGQASAPLQRCVLMSLSKLKNIPVFSRCPVSHGQSQFTCGYHCRGFLVSLVWCHSSLFSRFLSLSIPIDLPSLPDHCLSLHYTAVFRRQRPGLYSAPEHPQYLTQSLETAPVAVESVS